MEDTDRDWIQQLFESKLAPVVKDVNEIKQQIKDLPCGEHDMKLAQIEIRRVNGIEHMRQKREDARDKNTASRDYKDWLLKILIAAVALITLLYTVGFFHSMTKGK